MDGRRINVVDIESTCWLGNPPKGQQSEIIEIGICQINTKTWEISKPQSIIIKPEHSELSNFCKSLTGITPERLNKGTTLKNAIQILLDKWRTKKYAWGSWGMYDLRKFTEECTIKNIEYPFSYTHFNIKDLFAISTHQKRGASLQKAIKIIGSDFDGTPHCGKDDAYNAAKILKHILSPSDP